MIGCYFESWAMPWCDSLETSDLTGLDSDVDTIYLAFAKPNNTYVKNQKTFAGTGLEFSSSFDIIAKSIAFLKARNKKIFLSVGGGSYWSNPTVFNTQGCVDLMNDLGCDGIDIDWEVGISDDKAPVDVINSLSSLMLNARKISFTCFSTGAFTPTPNDQFSGMCVRALKECHHIDQVNIMGYDAGKDYSPTDALRAYRKIYDGPINMGFEIGKQGWGDALLTKSELERVCTVTKNESLTNGCFFWAYYSKPLVSASPETISREDATAAAYAIFKPLYTPPPPSPTLPPSKPTFTCPSSVFILCPTCKTKIKNSWSKE